MDSKVNTEYQIGPLSILQYALNNHTQLLINCRNNKKLLGRVKAFDKHLNLVLENVREMWVDNLPRKGKGKGKKTVSMDRFISKMFLRGDSIVLLVKNPTAKSV